MEGEKIDFSLTSGKTDINYLFYYVLKIQLFVCIVIYVLLKSLELGFPNKFGDINSQFNSFLVEFKADDVKNGNGEKIYEGENFYGEENKFEDLCELKEQSELVCKDEPQKQQQIKPNVGIEGEDKSVDDCSDVIYFKFKPPLVGKVCSRFGRRKDPLTKKETDEFHYGIDIIAKDGTPVNAIYDGVVSRVTNSEKSGKCLTLKHAEGYESIYAHCSEILVKTGDSVKIGQKVACSGHTGKVTGPHLHLGIRQNGQWIDPLECFPLFKKI